MNISEIFIRRPVTTTLLMASILIFGVMGYRQLPVSDLPNVDFPTIQVGASLPGASPETMASSVATPLERQFTTIAGLDNMSSSSVQGSTSITLQFNLSRDLDGAAQDVQSAIAASARQLPPNMPSPPTYQKVNPADQPVIYLTLTSATLPLSQLDEYGETMMAQRISTVSGVAQVQVYGPQKYAVRVQLDPSQLASRGIGIDEVSAAVQKANVNLPTGVLFGPLTSFTVQASGQLTEAAAYRPVIVAYRDGSPVRLSDLGRVIDGVENDKTAAWYNTERSISLAVFKQPGTNTVAVAGAVRELLPTFQKQLPAAASLHILYDRSQSIRASVNDVKFTLVLTLFLVVLVIFLFLRNVSATVIPSLALPLSIVGTFAAMYVLGYSLDNLSLMALTLSVGFVVDDAIVMLENIVRHMELGESVQEAALNGSREIGFTILSMTLSLAAVFIPILFMGGIIGRLFHEFAVTIGVAILVSGFVALSLTPMLCSRFLRHEEKRVHGRFYAVTEKVLGGMLHFYERTLRWVLARKRMTMAFSAAILVATVWLFVRIPKGFLPTEDQGQIFGFTEAAQGIGFPAMKEKQQAVAAVVRSHPDVANLLSSCGPRGAISIGNQGIVFAQLKPRSQRKRSAEQIVQDLRPKIAKIPGIRAFMQVPPPIRLGGSLTKSQYQYTLQDSDTTELFRYAPMLLEKLRAIPGLQDVTTDLQLNNPQINVKIDRDRAASLGVTPQAIEDALYTAYGPRQISTIYAPTNQYQVIMELAPEYPGEPCLDRAAVRAVGLGKARPAFVARRDQLRDGPPGRDAHGPAAFGLALVQPEAGNGAGRRGRGGEQGGPTGVAVHDPDELPGNGAGLSELDPGPGHPPAGGDRRDLHGARDPVRELHPPADDPLGAAVCGVWSARDALRLQCGALDLRLRRRDHARRARQEERHHDGRLCRRGAEARRKGRRGGDLRSLPRALPTDHDDDDGGADGNAADRDGLRRGRRVPAPARPGGRGRPSLLAAADPVRDPGLLHLHGPAPAAARPRQGREPRGAAAGRVPAAAGRRAGPRHRRLALGRELTRPRVRSGRRGGAARGRLPPARRGADGSAVGTGSARARDRLR